MAEVLRVISSSPGDLQTVFHAMLQNATRICDANFGHSISVTEMRFMPPRYTMHRRLLQKTVSVDWSVLARERPLVA